LTSISTSLGTLARSRRSSATVCQRQGDALLQAAQQVEQLELAQVAAAGCRARRVLLSITPLRWHQVSSSSNRGCA
jgi:hypothetical protein